jgi:hypothetical protein
LRVRSGLHPAGNDNDIPRLAVRNEMPTVASGHWLWPSNSAIDFSESRDRPPRTSDTKSIAVHAGPDQAHIRKTAAKYFRLFFCDSFGILLIDGAGILRNIVFKRQRWMW